MTIFSPPQNSADKRARRFVHARGFSLVELLVVTAIVSLLAAMLFPAFLTVRGKARQIACGSNLHQIGLGIAMYAQDYDGLYPRAVDPMDRFAPAVWNGFPTFAADIPKIGLIHQVLMPYTKSPTIFSCSSDSGVGTGDFNGLPLNAFPTSYEKFGTSYYYRTEIAARQLGDSAFAFPAETNVLFDGAGHWHGTLVPIVGRYNVLFADAHIKNLSRAQMAEAWQKPIN